MKIYKTILLMLAALLLCASFCGCISINIHPGEEPSQQPDPTPEPLSSAGIWEERLKNAQSESEKMQYDLVRILEFSKKSDIELFAAKLIAAKEYEGNEKFDILNTVFQETQVHLRKT